MKTWAVIKRYPQVIGLLILLFGLTTCNPIRLETPPQAVKGALDLRQWDFANNGVIKLTGEWEFYWQQLLTSADFMAAPPPPMTGFINIHGHWNGYLVDGQPIAGAGYATYRLKILLKDTPRPFGLIVPRLLLSAHSIYVNGQLVGAAGQVGSTANSTLPQDTAYVTFFDAPTDSLEIIIHISNFDNYEGGLLNSLEFGPQSQIYARNQVMTAFDFIVFGTVFIMGLYHLGLFSLRRQDNSPLYFGLTCLLITGRILIVNQIGFFNLFIQLPWSLSMRASILLSYLPLTTFLLFTQTLFPRQFSPRPLWFIHSLNALFIIVTLFANVFTFTALIQPFTIYVTLVFVYLTSVIVWAAWQHTEGALIYLFGLIAVFVTIINDILHVNGLIHTDHYVQFGLFMFIFSQAFLLSARFAQAFEQTETLSTKLQSQYQLLAQTQDSLRDALMLQAEANQNLKVEIEQRKTHQLEKDRLFELVQQQSEQLRTMTHWLIETQQNQRQGLSISLEQEFQQKIIVIHRNLNVLQTLLPNEAEEVYLTETRYLLTEMERYLGQITTDLEQPSTVEQGIRDNLLLQLTTREREVLQLVVEGKTNPEIADLLTITLGTVHTYLKRIRRKLDIHDVPGLVKFAQEHGLIK